MRAGDKAGFYVTIIKIKERKTEMTKVYVADDDRHIRELVGSFLKSVGLEVELFETGDQLFLRFLEEPAAVVVLDVMMPGSDGFRLRNACVNSRRFPLFF